MDKKAKRPRRPQVGMWIIWRFKCDKGWHIGYVRESFGAGYVVHLTDSEYASSPSGSKVCVDDIDWKIK
jgi:hypothetical protein